MELLAPWFLAGGLAVALPLWLHLMNRASPVRMPFSSLMFFRKRTETTVRERRLRYLLLLAARIALLLFLVAGVRQAGLAAASGGDWRRPSEAACRRAGYVHEHAARKPLGKGAWRGEFDCRVAGERG